MVYTRWMVNEYIRGLSWSRVRLLLSVCFSVNLNRVDTVIVIMKQALYLMGEFSSSLSQLIWIYDCHAQILDNETYLDFPR